MKKVLAFVFALGAVVTASQQPAPPPVRPRAAAAQPEVRLVLLIAVDQFRYDYLTRFRKDFTGGFDRLLTRGRGLHRRQSRALPHRHGDRPRHDAERGHAVGQRHHRQRLVRSRDGQAGREHHRHHGQADSAARQTRATASPRRLLVSTVGDEMKLASGVPKGAANAPKVIGVSLKDRSAVMPAGRGADAAYWFDNKSGAFVSSTYYMPDVPAWVQAFNDRHLADAHLGVEWTPLSPPAIILKADAEGEGAAVLRCGLRQSVGQRTAARVRPGRAHPRAPRPARRRRSALGQLLVERLDRPHLRAPTHRRFTTSPSAPIA